MSKNTFKTSSTINTMDNNTPQIKIFDPSVLIGKVIYELDNNIITWQLLMKGILQYYDLEDWVDIDHTPKVPIVSGIESTSDLIAPYEYKMKYGESVTKEDFYSMCTYIQYSTIYFILFYFIQYVLIFNILLFILFYFILFNMYLYSIF